jgi:hypothetical protein
MEANDDQDDDADDLGAIPAKTAIKVPKKRRGPPPLMDSNDEVGV